MADLPKMNSCSTGKELDPAELLLDQAATLLCTVYAPSSPIKQVLLLQCLRVCHESYSGDTDAFNRQFLIPVVQFLTDVKCRILTELRERRVKRNAGWPLCTNRSVIVHLVEPSIDDPTSAAVRPLQQGDFYLCLQRRNTATKTVETEEAESEIQLSLRCFDQESNGFQRYTLTIDDLVGFLCNQNTRNRYLTLPGRFESGKNKRLTAWLVSRGGAGMLERRNAFVTASSSTSSVSNLLTTTTVEDTKREDEKQEVTAEEKLSLVASQLDISAMEQQCAHSPVDRKTSSTKALKFPVPKDIKLVRADLVEAGWITINGGRLEDGSILVEMRKKTDVSSPVSPTDLARLLAYIHYCQEKCSRSLTTTRSTRTSVSDAADTVAPSRIEDIQIEDDLSGVTLLIDLTATNNAALTELEAFRAVCIRALKLLVMPRPGGSRGGGGASSTREGDGGSSNVQWLPDILKRVWFVNFTGSIEEQKDYSREIGMECDVLQMETLHERVSPSELSAEFGGARTSNGSLWIQFRRELEAFVRSCRTLGQQFIDLHKELRQTSLDDYGGRDPIELQQMETNLREKLHRIENSAVYAAVKNDGAEQLRHLRMDFAELDEAKIDTYTKAMEKAAGLYGEVSKILDKASLNVERRCTTLALCARARSLTNSAQKLLTWCQEVAMPKADRQIDEPSVSLLRLRQQERQFEEFLVGAKQKLKDGECLLGDIDSLRSDIATLGSNGNADISAYGSATLLLSPVSPTTSTTDGVASPTTPARFAFPESQSIEFDRLSEDLISALETTNDRLNRARTVVADRLVYHHMLEKAYEWALYNAKWSSQLGLLVSTAAGESAVASAKLLSLWTAVRTQLESYPEEDLKQLPEYAARLADQRLIGQAQSITAQCTRAQSLLESQRQTLDDLLKTASSATSTPPTPVIAKSEQPPQENDRNLMVTPDPTETLQRSVSPASTKYEQPIGRNQAERSSREDDREQQEADVVWRRRSYAGTSASTIEGVVAFRNSHRSAYPPSHRSSWIDGGSPPTERHDDEETNNSSTSAEDISSGVITSDMTDQVVSTMSESTLKKKLSERRSSNLSMGNMPPPNRLALQKGVRIGSERCYSSKQRRPFKKLIKRSWTEEDQLSTSSISHRRLHPSMSAPFCGLPPASADGRPLSRHASLQSLLESIGEEAASSGAGSVRSATACRRERSGIDDEEDDQRVPDVTPPTGSPSLSAAVGGGSTSLTELAWRPVSPPPDATPDQRMQFMIANELLTTEIAYVRSLHYVIQEYLPEMKRDDLPQELRGRRHAIFGNIEKIYEFHLNNFLPSLLRRVHQRASAESLCLEVARCFIEQRSRFHLYALYNKNKPKSDVLMNEVGGVFFKTRQLLLKDKLDLSSYLLKPVQRMGKFALLLQQLLKACPNTDQEAQEALRRAEEEIVSFQLRHGNDLLAMDLIVGCDVNLKEQGQLLRQDELIVYENRGPLSNRRTTRRVFLFEHLVLFAKPKRDKSLLSSNGSTEASYARRLLADTYQYKYSIKMTDCGLTEKVRENERKFELWFRRHTSNTTYVLEARTAATRQSWVNEITKLLWRQATRNRDDRLSEQSMMCMSNRSSCVDLHSSADRIEDRAVNSTLLNKMAKFRSSFAAFTSSSAHGGRPHSQSASNFASVANSQLQPTQGQSMAAAGKRPHSLISLGTGSSCSSGSSNSSSSVVLQRTTAQHGTTLGSVESGICADLPPVSECAGEHLVDEKNGFEKTTLAPVSEKSSTISSSCVRVRDDTNDNLGMTPSHTECDQLSRLFADSPEVSV